jgi:hypothetical protein
MKNIILFIIAAFITALGFNNAKAQTIPIVQADTVFAGFGGGSVSGIVFGPDGNTVILMHNATPTEIDIKTHKVLREFEKVPNASGAGEDFKVIKGYNYLSGSFSSSEINGIKNFAGTIIWDEATGKIVKALSKNYFVVGDNQVFNWISGKNYFYKFDLNSFKEIDSMFIDPNLDGDGSSEWCRPAVIPNSNKVLFGVNRYIENESGDKTYLLGELYLLDFDTKKYTKIDIPYESGQKSSAMGDITITETGKYNIVRINKNYYFYDKNFIFMYKLSLSDLELMTNIENLFNYSIVMSVSDDYLIFFVYSQTGTQMKMLFYNIQDRNITKYLGFLGSGVYDKSSQKIALYGILGISGIYNLSSLPVIENDIASELQNKVIYQNNNLVINSLISEKVDINITDYQGDLLQSQKDVFLHNGSNTIKLNNPLGNGVYFCVIKSSTGNNSFKFMVCR